MANEEDPSGRSPDASGAERPLSSIVSALARAIDTHLPPGDVAALRRMPTGELATPAFWRLAGTVLEGVLRGDGPTALERERQWATIVSALAVSAGLHSSRRSFGAALAEAGYSELRLTRLLRAHGATLPAEVRAATAFLSSKAVPFDGVDLAALVLSDGGPSEEVVRRNVAKGYYAQLSRKDN